MGDAACYAHCGADAEVTGGRGDGGTVRRVLVAAAIFSGPLSLCPTAPLFAQSWRTITSARQVHGERELSVDIRYGAGRFSLAPGTEDELYRMEMRYDEERFTPVREFDADAGTLRLGLRSQDGARGIRISLGDRRRNGPTPNLTVALSPDVPLSLNLELGAVAADVELGGLAIRRVHYETGASQTHLRFSRTNPMACDVLSMEAGAAEFNAENIANANCSRVTFHGGVGEVTLDFGGTWRHSMTADVEVGVGSLNLRLPRDVGVSVKLNRFLASFDAAGFQKRGGTYYSSNFNTARYRLTLDINAAFGGIEIAWVDR